MRTSAQAGRHRCSPLLGLANEGGRKHDPRASSRGSGPLGAPGVPSRLSSRSDMASHRRARRYRSRSECRVRLTSEDYSCFVVLVALRAEKRFFAEFREGNGSPEEGPRGTHLSSPSHRMRPAPSSARGVAPCPAPGFVDFRLPRASVEAMGGATPRRAVARDSTAHAPGLGRRRAHAATRSVPGIPRRTKKPSRRSPGCTRHAIVPRRTRRSRDAPSAESMTSDGRMRVGPRCGAIRPRRLGSD